MDVWKTWIRIAGGFLALGPSWPRNNGVCKDANRQRGFIKRYKIIVKDCSPSASLQTPIFALSIFLRVQEPAAIRPYGLRVFQTHCWRVCYEQWEMNFIKSYELAQNIIYKKLQIAEIQVLESCYFYSHFVRPNSILLSKTNLRLAIYCSE